LVLNFFDTIDLHVRFSVPFPSPHPSSRLHSTPTFPFLALPSELRTEIFTYACHDGTYYIDTFHVRSLLRPSWPSLVATCRQIKAETALLPYTLNKFDFVDMGYADNWLRRLDKVVPMGEKKLPLKVVVHVGWYLGRPVWDSQSGPILKQLAGRRIELVDFCVRRTGK
jgi:hypothetical protein